MKTTFNWGTGITIAIIAFMGFILFIVFQATSTDADLYADDYYQQEIDYQDKIDAKANTNELKNSIKVQQTEDIITIDFPNEFVGQSVTGTAFFYRPDNASLDKRFKIKTTDNQQIIMKKNITSGQYDLKINCKVNSKVYFMEQTIYIN
jgi:hypothetical protein